MLVLLRIPRILTRKSKVDYVVLVVVVEVVVIKIVVMLIVVQRVVVVSMYETTRNYLLLTYYKVQNISFISICYLNVILKSKVVTISILPHRVEY
jgi:hypothetical protein